MKLMSGEKILLESDTKELVLTTHRVRFEAKEWGKARLTSIMLDELCSCEIRHASRPILIILAALSVIGGIASQASWSFAVGFIVGLILTLAYFLTRRGVIYLASDGATINARTSGMSFETGRRFVDEVEVAKDQRYQLLHGR